MHLDKTDVTVTAGIRHENTLFDAPRNFADGKSVPYLKLRSSTRLNSSDILELRMGYLGGTRDWGEVPSLTEPPTKDRLRSNFIQARFRRLLGPNEELSFHAYRNERTSVRDYLTLPLPIPGVPPPGLIFNPRYEVSEERIELEFQHSLPLGNNIRGAWGVAARYDENYSPQVYQTEKPLTNTVYRLFGTAQWQVRPQVTIHGGIMIEDNELGGTEVMPRAAVNWQLQPRHALRASLSRGTRAPTFREESSRTSFFVMGQLLDVQDFASGDLKSESLHAFEVGYIGSSASGHWSWDTKLFYERVKDIVAEIRPQLPFPEPLSDGVAFDWINLDSATAIGAEIQIDYRDRKNLLRVTHTEIDIDGTDLSQRSIVSASAPSRSTSVFYMRQLPQRWFMGIALMRNSDSIPLDSDLVASASTRVDFRVGKRFKRKSVRGEVGLMVENLFDRRIDEHKGNQVFERRAYITLKLDW